ncbi:MAG: N-acetylneuraminate synthase family protein [Candidatus Obscuribacter sp.]|nr:N-acetylneuraminate synthase family protein [Candidatus Obscuribacter sp.]
MRGITTLLERFGLVTALSEHSAAQEVALATEAMGQQVIEKHITKSRDQPVPDPMA